VAALKKKLDRFVENEECIPCEEEFEAHLHDRYGRDCWTVDVVPPCL